MFCALCHIFTYIPKTHKKDVNQLALYCGPRKPIEETSYVHAYTRTFTTCSIFYCFEIS